MAVISSNVSTRFEVVVTLAAIDHNGQVRTREKTFTLNPGVVLYADAVLATEAMLALLDAATEADILKYRITTVFDDGSIGSVAGEGELWNEALLTLNSDVSANKISHTVYAPIDAMVSGSAIVISNAQLLAYLDVFETGGDFTLSDGETIPVANQVVKGRVRRVASGKSL